MQVESWGERNIERKGKVGYNGKEIEKQKKLFHENEHTQREVDKYINKKENVREKGREKERESERDRDIRWS